MIWRMLSVILVVIPAIVATIFQLNAWPFDSYPMFSMPTQAETLTFIRIAYEDKDSRLHWWKPHYYKLVETFGQEAKACFGFAPPVRGRRLNLLFAKIEHCIANDPAAKDAVSICLVKRCFKSDEEIGWHMVDTFVHRRPIARQSRTHS
jgi:hypothetical protein